MIRLAENRAELEQCARLMSSMDPWITLKRDFDSALKAISDENREVYVAHDELGIAGFIVLCMIGPLSGYIQTVLVAPDRQGKGLGTQLIEFAERRIFSESPNSFLCVSSFNSNARKLYERLGYEYIGELKDFAVSGYSELLYRKTLGPWRSFAPRK